MTEYFKIGKFAAVFGVQGELILKHHLGKKTALKGQQALFTEEGKDRFLPWFITGARAKNNDEILLALADVTTREAALPLLQKEVWLPEEDFKKFAATASPLNLLGYQMQEGTKLLGIIEEVIEQPHQLLCRIDVQGKEALIPLHEASLLKIDRKNKIVTVQLPAGLLEIYL